MKIFKKSVVALSLFAVCGAIQAATYQIEPLPEQSDFRHTFGRSINNQGQVTFLGTDKFNFPVQFQYFSDADFDAIKSRGDTLKNAGVRDVALEDFDALKAGTPTANDLALVIDYLNVDHTGLATSRKTSLLYQKVGSSTSFLAENTQITPLTLFDQSLADDRKTYSTTDVAYGINAQQWLYGIGNAPALPLAFTNDAGTESTYWLRAFEQYGFVSVDNGQTIIPIMPPEARFGGQSALFAMNDNLQGAGYVSTAIQANALERMESEETGNCANADNLKNTPLAACIQVNRAGQYELTAAKFTFNEQGEVVDTQLLPQLITNQHTDDTRVLKSYAQAINNSGTLVGYANGWYKNDVTEPASNETILDYATIYKNDQVIDVNTDHENFFNSRLYDINDAGIAVGFGSKVVNGVARTKFFYVDTTQETPTMVFPTDFFSGSASETKSINNNGLIVGNGQVEFHNDQSGNAPRRRHGFMYDIAQEKFTDLNDFLTCNSPYTIISATDINDNNEIIATATINVEMRDAKGELVLDSDGNPKHEDVARAVVLKPIVGGEVDDCSTVEPKVERKGASLGYLLGLPLLLLGFRNRRKN